MQRASGQETAGSADTTPPALVQPSLEGTGPFDTARAAEASPFATPDSGTFNFGSGFRGDCRPASTASVGAVGTAPQLEVISAPDSNASRYVQVSLSASETYTDNLNRDPVGREISDYITQISPRIDACASSGRIQGTLSYTPQFVLYANNSEYSDIYQTIVGRTTVNIWPGHFYLDADSRYGQTVVDPSISYSQSNALAPDNQTGTWTSNISPYAVQSLGPVGTALLRYRYGRVIYEDDDVPGSTINAAYLTVTSPPDRGRLSWKADAQTQKVERSGGDARRYFSNSSDVDPGRPVFDSNDTRDSSTTYFDRASLELGYQATRLIKLNASGGVEDDYQEDGTNDRLSEPFWEAGVRLGTPSNSLEARVGHHFYGTSLYIDARHRGRLFDASASYDEQPSSAGLNALNSNGSFGSIPGTGLGVPVESRFDRGIFVEKRASVQLGLDMQRTSTGLTFYRKVREYIAAGQDDETYHGASLQTRYQLGPRMSLVPSVSWQNRESDGNGQFGGGYDTYETGLTLARALSPSSQAAIGYAHAERDGERRNSDYTENRVTLQFMKNF